MICSIHGALCIIYLPYNCFPQQSTTAMERVPRSLVQSSTTQCNHCLTLILISPARTQAATATILMCLQSKPLCHWNANLQEKPPELQSQDTSHLWTRPANKTLLLLVGWPSSISSQRPNLTRLALMVWNFASRLILPKKCSLILQLPLSSTQLHKQFSSRHYKTSSCYALSCILQTYTLCYLIPTSQSFMLHNHF